MSVIDIIWPAVSEGVRAGNMIISTDAGTYDIHADSVMASIDVRVNGGHIELTGTELLVAPGWDGSETICVEVSDNGHRAGRVSIWPEQVRSVTVRDRETWDVRIPFETEDAKARRIAAEQDLDPFAEVA